MSQGRLLPVLMAVVFGAALIAAWGVTSLALDSDVISQSDAGPLLGPAMAGAAVLSTWGWLVRLGRAAGSWGIAVMAAASSWFAMLLVGGAGYALTKGSLSWLVLFPGQYAISPFLLVPAAIAGLTVVVTAAIAGRSPEARSFDPR